MLATSVITLDDSDSEGRPSQEPSSDHPTPISQNLASSPDLPLEADRRAPDLMISGVQIQDQDRRHHQSAQVDHVLDFREGDAWKEAAGVNSVEDLPLSKRLELRRLKASKELSPCKSSHISANFLSLDLSSGVKSKPQSSAHPELAAEVLTSKRLR